MRVIYTVVSVLALPAIVIRLWWRGRRLPGYRRRVGERFGFVHLERDARPLVWVHAVSVGETIAAAPVVKFLLERGDVQVLVTNMTPTGSERAQELFGDQVLHSYMPYDIPWLLNRFLLRARPSLLLIMETELWPNTIRACGLHQVPVVLLNARLSKKSARGYSYFSGLTEEMLQGLAHVAVQAQADARRFRELGLPQQACAVTGSIKFDLALDDALVDQAEALKQAWSLKGQRLIWIAASTHAGEEEQVIQAFQQVKKSHTDVLLVLVPRHPDRFEQVAKLCEGSGLRWTRRSTGSVPDVETDIVLGDTMGEMLLLYGTADIAYVGGSLVHTGGHNFIEPAAWGIPLLSGPHLFNFAQVASLMLARGALTLVDNADALASVVCRLLSEPLVRYEKGTAARNVADANRGALARVETLIERYLPERDEETVKSEK